MAAECEAHCPDFCSARAATWKETEFATPELITSTWERFGANWEAVIDHCPGPTLADREVEEKFLRFPGVRRFFGRPTTRVRTNDTYACTSRS